MDSETIKYLSAFAISLVAWGGGQVLWMTKLLNSSKRTEEKVDALITQQADSDKVVRDVMREQSRVGREQVHYLRWMAEGMNGKKPPPYIDGA